MITMLHRCLGSVAIAALSIMIFKAITGVSETRLAMARAEFEHLEAAENSLRVRSQNLIETSPQRVILPSALVWLETDDGPLDLLVQKSVLEAARSAGVQLTTFGSSSGPDAAHHQTIGFELEGTAGHIELAQFLANIESLDPRLAVSSLWLRSVAPIDGELDAPVSIHMTLWAFRSDGSKTP